MIVLKERCKMINGGGKQEEEGGRRGWALLGEIERGAAARMEGGINIVSRDPSLRFHSFELPCMQ